MLEELRLFNELAELLIEKEVEEPVAKPIRTSQLYKAIDLSLTDEPTLDSDFIETLKQIVGSTPKTASKSFFNQLFGGRMPKATLGDLMAVMFNNSMYTYKVAGPQVGIEKEVLKRTAILAGYPENFGGTLAPGGSMSNYMSLIMARDKFDPTIRDTGVTAKLCLYTSETSHYSISKNASFAGIGRKQVRLVKVNAKGEMLVADLESKIKQDIQAGHHPFYVNTTAGTTVLGTFDDVVAISAVCQKYKLWLHVDGAYCGSVIFSQKYKHLLKGIELSDSFSLNAHKMLGTPLSCSIILTRDKFHLYQSFSNDAEYLYQTADDEYNLGKTSLQCGRRNDALKLWTLWKSIGTLGLEKLVDHQFKMADLARNYIRSNPDYTLYSFDQSISVCFNYKDIPAAELCTALYQHSKVLVGFGQFKEDKFVRLVTINSSLEEKDVRFFFETLEEFAENHLITHAESAS